MDELGKELNNKKKQSVGWYSPCWTPKMIKCKIVCSEMELHLASGITTMNKLSNEVPPKRTLDYYKIYNLTEFAQT